MDADRRRRDHRAGPGGAGFGARIARGLVAFVGASGPLVVIELTEPLRVRAPLGWTANSVAVGVEDVDGLIAAIAAGAGGRRPAERPRAEGLGL